MEASAAPTTVAPTTSVDEAPAPTPPAPVPVGEALAHHTGGSSGASAPVAAAIGLAVLILLGATWAAAEVFGRMRST